MSAQVLMEKETAFRLIAHLKDFEGTVAEWKNAFYEIWRYQLTFDFAYEIMLWESNKNGVYIDVLCREAYHKPALTLFDDLGMKNVDDYEEWIGLVQDYDLKYEDAVDSIIVV